MTEIIEEFNLPSDLQKSNRGGKRPGAGRKPGSSQPRFADGWYVYLVGETPCSGVMKVGIARSPYSRISGLQTGNPKLLRFVAIWSIGSSDTYGALEKAIHRSLRAFNVRGEWFDADAGLIGRHIEESVEALGINAERVF
jgi:hypothetical protein